jgi:hypothetical protein
MVSLETFAEQSILIAGLGTELTGLTSTFQSMVDALRRKKCGDHQPS